MSPTVPLGCPPWGQCHHLMSLHITEAASLAIKTAVLEFQYCTVRATCCRKSTICNELILYFYKSDSEPEVTRKGSLLQCKDNKKRGEFNADTVSSHSALAEILANYMRGKCSSGLPFQLQHHFEFSAISLSFTKWKTLIQSQLSEGVYKLIILLRGKKKKKKGKKKKH